MHELTVLIIGAACGIASTIGIYFAPDVPGRHNILAAGTIRGAIVALLTALTAGVSGTWLLLTGYGVLYGIVVGLMVVLSKGEAAWQHVKFIIPASTIAGAASGILIWLFAG